MIARSFELPRCCFGVTLVAGMLLAGSAAMAQVAATPERYGSPAAASPPAANGSGNAGGVPPAAANDRQNAPPPAVAPSGNRMPVGASAPAGMNGFGGSANSASNPAAANPYGQGVIPSGTNSRTLPFSGSNSQPLSGANPTPPTQPGYPSMPPANAAYGSPLGAGMKPSALMREMLKPPAGSRLQGRPASLQDVIAGAQHRSDQTQRVEAYWDLCSSVADYYLGLREQDELRQLRSLVQQVGPTWSQAESDLNIRVGTSQRAALASQLRLANLIGRGSNDLLLPTDTPHCASYDTQFERIFLNGAPAEARELAAVLPARYAELKSAAAAVSRGKEWVESVARGDSDGTGTLRALELWALQRRAFVQIARDYNRRIARYSELASPGQLSPVRLTSMLIYTSAAATPIPSYTAPSRNLQSAAPPLPPRTFAESSSSAIKPITGPPADAGDVQPVSAEQAPQESPAAAGDEKSLLVAPLQP